MTWNYKVVYLSTGDDAEDETKYNETHEAQLNALGLEGWELVSVQWGPDDDYFLRAFLKKSGY